MADRTDGSLPQILFEKMSGVVVGGVGSRREIHHDPISAGYVVENICQHLLTIDFDNMAW
jgi:hypothetical protein